MELLVERVTSSTTAQVMLRASKKPLAGALLKLLRAGISIARFGLGREWHGESIQLFDR